MSRIAVPWDKIGLKLGLGARTYWGAAVRIYMRVEGQFMPIGWMGDYYLSHDEKVGFVVLDSELE